ncbi:MULTISPECIES: hypothetical protein [Pseudomonas]|jgi:hypothetical protein|uniref:Lipoprotein n=1 Tax=Pseudomonas fluorescens LMG 5329 TaxID=1324332 RepID=A0A0A1YWL0_PSEFL|nr:MULTISPECIES: hypothetical protein [Pseudomonas]KGE66303.1 hypothetical protein K814_0119350 [Pseudomonas fluorescens LMG 5329]NWE01942.1 hypothetical protein [Pseudomonas sp. IPO3749]NWF22143.1 hypothetical protein [Pseudomonas sp. IPO3749]
MKNLLLAVSFLVSVTACDNSTQETHTSLTSLSNGIQVPSSAKEVKSYIAKKDNVDRQHYLFDIDKPVSEANEELSRVMKSQGFAQLIKSQEKDVSQFYFNKEKSPTVVAVLKPINSSQTRLAMSWEMIN